MRAPLAAVLASALLAPSLARAGCTMKSVSDLVDQCTGANAPQDCGGRFTAMKTECQNVAAGKGTEAESAASTAQNTLLQALEQGRGRWEAGQFKPDLSVGLLHGAPDQGGAITPTGAAGRQQPHGGSGVSPDADGHGAPAYHPEETNRTVHTALADGDFKGATQGVKQMLDNGDRKSAGPALDQIIKQAPGNPEARGLRAQSRIMDGDVSGALDDARVVLKSDPQNQMARQIEAWAESQGRDIHLKKSLALDFNSRNESERGAGGGGDPRRLASASPAGAALAAAGSARPGPAIVYSRVGGPASDALAEARRFAALGDYARAQSEIERALSYDAKNAEALAVSSRLSNKRNDFDGAIKAADAALALDPKNVAALLERGYAKYSLGHYKDALADVEQALSIDPLNAMGHLYRAMILERMDRAQEAVKEYMKAAELDASLKPLVDDALARLGLSPATAAGRAARRYWPVWAGVLALAFVLFGFGLKRVVRPEWATPMTPSTPLR